MLKLYVVIFASEYPSLIPLLGSTSSYANIVGAHLLLVDVILFGAVLSDAFVDHTPPYVPLAAVSA